MVDASDLESYERNARAIAALVDDSREILEGLLALRSAGSVNGYAVEAVLGTRDVNRIRLGWELFEVLSEGAGLDSERMLLECMDLDDFVLARAAIWTPND